MLFGAETQPDGSVRFRLFAPAANTIRLALEGSPELLSMQALGGGWHEIRTAQALPGSRYRFLLPDGTAVPDPTSRFQPDDVSGPSEVIDPANFPWTDAAWQGRPWCEAVLYELHIGTFTPEGTFRAATAKLDHLAATGITAIELMCLADFAGTRNWGYDSVLLYAPDSSYGRPEDLKALIDAAHARNLQVFLDVVYNHFGPEGNDLPKYFPQLLTSEHCTPWGDALNFDVKSNNGGVELDGECARQVRELIIQNALYWVEEFHIDGLRLDAAHAILDNGPLHVLDELCNRVRDLAAHNNGGPPRHVHLIREDENNVAPELVRDEQGRPQRFTAQWNHDMSHLLGAAMRTDFEGQGSGDSGSPDDETGRLVQALAEGFSIAAEENGTADEIRCHVPPTAYIAFVQTHDLIGNRIAGERIHALVPPVAVRAVMALLLLLPQTPMLFMGDEFAASSPFPYFCDFHGDLAETVRKGRCEFLAKLHNASEDDLKSASNPQDPQTFQSAKLDWGEIEDPAHGDWLPWYAAILGTRLARLAPLLHDLAARCGSFRVLTAGAFEIAWHLQENATLNLAANLRPNATQGFTQPTGDTLWLEGTAPTETELGPWSIRWTLA